MRGVRIIAFFSIILLRTLNLSAQKVVTDIRYFDNYGLRCEGETIELGYNEEFSCFQKHVGVCGSSFPEIIEDRSSEIQVTGVTSYLPYEHRSYYAGSNYAKIRVMMISVKLTESTEVKVVSRSPIDFEVGNQCPNDPPEDYVLERVWIYKIRVVKKPSTPTLRVERYISEQNVQLIASGCPTENSEIDYEYQWNSTSCLADLNSYYTRNELKDGKKEGAGGEFYRVRCAALNGTCVSEPSDFQMGLTYMRPTRDCMPDRIEGQIEEIENIRRPEPPLPNYHYYSQEAEICSKSDKCTKQSVFNFMTSEVQFVAPISQDFPLLFFPLNRNRWTPPTQKVEPCGIVNLPAGFGESRLKGGAFSPSASDKSVNPVMTHVDQSSFSVINYTLKEHVFSPGRIIRTVVERCGKIYIITLGEGLSQSAHPDAIAYINGTFGPGIFENVNERFKQRFNDEILSK